MSLIEEDGDLEMGLVFFKLRFYLTKMMKNLFLKSRVKLTVYSLIIIVVILKGKGLFTEN